jgi:hypothetical protein
VIAQSPRPNLESRVAGLVKGRGYCPSCKRRSRSLSIGEGSDGRALVRCFAGCAPAEIVAAVGLRLVDLFPPRDPTELARREAQEVERRRRFRQAPRETVEAFLLEDVQRTKDMRLARDPGDTPNVRAVDVNTARARANSIFGLNLAPIQRFEWEGWAPHDRDQLWPKFLEHARREVLYEKHLQLYPDAIDVSPSPLLETPATLHRAAERAARRLHTLGGAA